MKAKGESAKVPKVKVKVLIKKNISLNIKRRKNLQTIRGVKVWLLNNKKRSINSLPVRTSMIITRSMT